MYWNKFNYNIDYLELDGQRINRPSYMSFSQWEDWCRAATNIKTYEDGYNDGADLQKEYEYTEQDLENAEEEGRGYARSDIQYDIKRLIEYIENILSEKVTEDIIDELKSRVNNIGY